MIYYIDLEAITNQELVTHYIYPNMDLNYYWSDSFDPQFYIHLAQAGFISTAMHDDNDHPVLLPEIQFEYAVLHFEDLHISKKVQKLLRKNQYHFSINKHFNEVLNAIHDYHKMPWLNLEYQEMLKQLHSKSYENFEVISVELCNENQELIAGEVGYIIGKTYTSLTGFFKREKQYNHWGKLQLILLGQYLQNNDFDFWNLGHASLQYKLDMGAKVYDREDFLHMWLQSTVK